MNVCQSEAAVMGSLQGSLLRFCYLQSPETLSVHYWSSLSSVIPSPPCISMHSTFPDDMEFLHACLGNQNQGDKGMATDLACQYLVAADGAGSMVRRLAGVRMEGHEEMQNLISVHFFSKQLGRQLLATPEPGMLYFVFNPAVIAVVVAHNLEAGEFVAQVPVYDAY